MKKNMGKIGWPIVGLVCVGIATSAAVSSAQYEGINAVLLMFCSIMFTAGAFGAAVKTKEAWI